MSQVKLIKWKIKPGAKQVWIDWCEEVKQRSNEVMETLENEGMRLEACFLSEEENEVYFFWKADDVSRVEEAFKNSQYKIDVEHSSKKSEALELVGEMKELYCFVNE